MCIIFTKPVISLKSAQIWRNIIGDYADTHFTDTPADFDEVPGVVAAPMCTATGLIAGPYCPKGIQGYWKSSNAPVCDGGHYGAMPVDNGNGNGNGYNTNGDANNGNTAADPNNANGQTDPNAGANTGGWVDPNAGAGGGGETWVDPNAGAGGGAVAPDPNAGAGGEGGV